MEGVKSTTLDIHCGAKCAEDCTNSSGSYIYNGMTYKLQHHVIFTCNEGKNPLYLIH